MVESITNYTKLARASIIFKIECAYITLQTSGFLILVVLLATYYPAISKEWNETSKVDDGLIITAVFFLIVPYIAEVILVFILYKGIKEKHTRKLVIWMLVQVGLNVFYSLSAVVEIIERGLVGTSPYVFTFLILVYRCIAIKIVYDAIKELRKFPVTVSFVQMRNCEDRV